LGALIPTAMDSADMGIDNGFSLRNGPAPIHGPVFREIAVDSVTPNPRQPRMHFDEETLEELAASLREVGLLQPIVVREIMPGRYELVMGERRWRASKLAGFSQISAIVRDTADDAMLREALLENLHRQQLNPLEEAAAYEQLLHDFGATHEELAGKLGRSRSHVTNMIRLLGLPTVVQRRVAAGVLSAGHARALLALGDSDAQDRLAARIVAEGLSVRAVEEIVAMGAEELRKTAPPRAPRVASPALGKLAARLSDRFDTRVKVDMGRSKGKITVEFASVEDLERIVAVMTAPESGSGTK
jgi:ParB family chromosome partitioning protein